jgi:very-short-patch-repair endonuclease
LAQTAPETPVIAATSDRTRLEDRFLRLWTDLGGPPLEREYRFAPTRRFRADFVFLSDPKFIVEIDGATQAGVKGGHTSFAGYAAGCEKGNIAQAMGYRFFRLTAAMIVEKHVRPIIELAGPATFRR